MKPGQMLRLLAVGAALWLAIVAGAVYCNRSLDSRAGLR